MQEFTLFFFSFLFFFLQLKDSQDAANIALIDCNYRLWSDKTRFLHMINTKGKPVVIELTREGKSVLKCLSYIWRQITLAKISGREIVFVLKVENSGKNGSKYILLKQFSLSRDNHSYRFSALIKVIRIIRENLTENITTTFRDIYYKDVSLFQKNQRNAAKIVKDLAFTLGVTPEDGLQVVPGQKGLIYGNIVIQHPHGDVIDFKEPGLIPHLTSNSPSDYTIKQGQPKAILILEKEAVFRSICKELKDLNYDHNLIIITGKGFPCGLTKKFVAVLEFHFVNIPILAFVDSDIYGIQICANYLASIRSKFDNCDKFNASKFQIQTTSPQNFSYCGVFLLEYKNGWLDITNRDWKRMQNFLIQFQTCYLMQEDSSEKKFYHEVSRGMIFRKKCEMNSVNEKYLDYVMKKVNSKLKAKLYLSNFIKSNEVNA